MAKEVVAFKRLNDLGVAIVEQVDKMLFAGTVPSQIAKWLHEDQKVLLDLKLGSIQKNLERYRDKVLPTKVKAELAETKVLTPAVKKKLLAIDALSDLVAIQMGRLDKVLVKENGSPFLMKSASDEGRLLKEMLIELGKLQLETGVMKKAPKTFSGSTFDPSTGEVKQFSWTEEQEQMFKTIENLELVDEEAPNAG